MELKNTNHIFKDKLTSTDQFSIWITDRIGTIGFFLVILLWTFIWLGWNMLAPDQYRFDPSPGFILWLFISNMIQIFLMPLLLVGQNLQAKRSEIRAENDYAVNKKAELEIKELMNEMTVLKTMIADLSKK